MHKRLYFHSPFSENAFTKTEGSLLLQFILEELFLSEKTCREKNFELFVPPKIALPFSLTLFQKTSPLDKLREHASLLPFAFPFKKQEISIFLHALSNTANLAYNYTTQPGKMKNFTTQIIPYIRQMFFLLEPFMEECKNEEAFLFFLFSHQKEISLLSNPLHLSSLLKRFHPKGLSFVQEYVCDHFYRKGFSYLIPEIKVLVGHIKKSRL